MPGRERYGCRDRADKNGTGNAGARAIRSRVRGHADKRRQQRENRQREQQPAKQTDRCERCKHCEDDHGGGLGKDKA